MIWAFSTFFERNVNNKNALATSSYFCPLLSACFIRNVGKVIFWERTENYTSPDSYRKISYFHVGKTINQPSIKSPQKKGDINIASHGWCLVRFTLFYANPPKIVTTPPKQKFFFWSGISTWHPHDLAYMIPSGNFTVCEWTWPIDSWFIYLL